MQCVILQTNCRSEVNAAVSACCESRWGLLDRSQCCLKVSSVTNRIEEVSVGVLHRWALLLLTESAQFLEAQSSVLRVH